MPRGAVINPQDRMVHPVDIGKESPATLPGAPGQVYNDPTSNNPASLRDVEGRLRPRAVDAQPVRR